eukprot:TRINITY_DN4111_c0_g1_i5.p1 TRINITY_DN4111_c0_g1~~TRINITY_DN4111_c0_g1_i5.p1  ORF type:complete len:276 (+),score=33.11 TRINITY_DN4111_c0_g1_i5:41-868(+)
MGLTCSCSGAAVLESNKLDEKGLVKIDLNERYLTDIKVEQVMAIVKENGSMSSLLLGWTGLSLRGMTTICESASTHQALSTLVLNGNNIRNVSPVAHLLRKNPSLTYVNLGSNSIEESGCKVLLQSLRTNSNLRFLSVSGNNIQTTDPELITANLGASSSLLLLDLRDNPIPPDILNKLEFSFKKRSLPAESVPSPPASGEMFPSHPPPPPPYTPSLSSLSTDSDATTEICQADEEEAGSSCPSPPFPIEFTSSSLSWEITRNSPLELSIEESGP